MRIGIVSTNEVQKALFTELLSPLVGDLIMYDISHAKAGDLEISNAHILLVDMNDQNVVDCDEVLEALGREEPICLVHDKDLYSMQPRERISWRNRTIDEIKKALPDLAAELDEKKEEADNKNAPDVWIIGASSGGPQALRHFFADLPRMPISIFVAQHISEPGYVQMLARLKDVASMWSVHSAETGMKVKPNSVYLVPRDHTIHIAAGVISLQPYSAQSVSFNPCIDAVIRSVHECHPQVGVIIMSGMGMDGSGGVRTMKGKAKLIMAQDSESSGAKSMPDSARNTGAVQFSAPPEGLARKLAQLYGQRTY
ncbi:chemotaxis protein CheB [Pseudomonas mosselii]|uniref:chemotaxis protein CheB n=1 Tax=Pseudomonas mosselii TaxID=78327 RepID=UPI0021DA5858|nr:chemotaxis protein CheB [Pseudomonas mosselii]MCU9528524.1 chemotaxis protein CheB [Pseudomonas mosselii]MCU9535858.1 chemotaxis protein CheB [Pseudomonas mosselii]MCU9542916.1 chemotaxis protein CheB [Pseudomonas mosselii]MCU9548797.1 chemotaxis protein CheB [Pseudomonas mosselii]